MAKRIPLTLMVVLASMVLAACSDAPEAAVPEPAQGAATKGRSDVLRFTLEENGRRQDLEVRRRTRGAIDVAISVAGACTRSETGSAKTVDEEGDVEVEVDPEGEGHPVDEFILTSGGKCRISVRLAAPDRDYAWLREADCAAECPLSKKSMARK